MITAKEARARATKKVDMELKNIYAEIERVSSQGQREIKAELTYHQRYHLIDLGYKVKWNSCREYYRITW